MSKPDVVVVGAGPGGTAAAITLSRVGARVLLLDRARFPRDKSCGDGLTACALRRLEALGLDTDLVRSWCPTRWVFLRSPSGRVLELPLAAGPATYAAVARRNDLDAALVDLARESRVTVIEGCQATGASAGGQQVSVETCEGSITAPYVIAADGMWSPLRRALDRAANRAQGLSESSATSSSTYLGEWHAARQYFSSVGPQARRGMWVWFEPEVLPGYAWSFPLGDGFANVGFGLVRAPGRTVAMMKGLWEELLARPHIKNVLGAGAHPESPRRSWPIPARIQSLHSAEGRVLFVGDAARVADPMTGEGIAQALETGILAARAISGSGSDSQLAASAYCESVRRGIAVDNRLAGLLSTALRSSTVVRAAIRVSGASGWTRHNFARWMMEDYPRAAPLTPSRWRQITGDDLGAQPSSRTPPTYPDNQADPGREASREPPRR